MKKILFSVLIIFTAFVVISCSDGVSGPHVQSLDSEDFYSLYSLLESAVQPLLDDIVDLIMDGNTYPGLSYEKVKSLLVENGEYKVTIEGYSVLSDTNAINGTVYLNFLDDTVEESKFNLEFVTMTDIGKTFIFDTSFADGFSTINIDGTSYNISAFNIEREIDFNNYDDFESFFYDVSEEITIACYEASWYCVENSVTSYNDNEGHSITISRNGDKYYYNNSFDNWELDSVNNLSISGTVNGVETDDGQDNVINITFIGSDLPYGIKTISFRLILDTTNYPSISGSISDFKLNGQSFNFIFDFIDDDIFINIQPE